MHGRANTLCMWLCGWNDGSDDLGDGRIDTRAGPKDEPVVGTGSAHKWAKIEHAHQHHTYVGEILYVKREPHIHGNTAGITAKTEGIMRQDRS